MAPQQARQYIECVPGKSHPSARPRVVRLVSQSPQPISQSPPCTLPRISGPASPVLPPTPSGSGRHPRQHLLTTRRLDLGGSTTHHHTVPNTRTSTTSSIRRRGRAILHLSGSHI